MPVNVQIEETPIADKAGQLVVRIASGYHEGELLSMPSVQYPQHFENVEQAKKWLTDTGFTVVHIKLK